MNAKKWIWAWIVITSIGVTTIMSINYWVDPLWCFGHSNQFSHIRSMIDERQQKTNYLYHTDQQFNTIILGSSRSTYLAPTYFKTLKVFNYAANNMLPNEFEGHLKNYVDITEKAPENIILGLDFWGSSISNNSDHFKPDHYLSQRKQRTYLPSNLASIDALEYTLRNIKYSISTPPLNDAYYDQHLTKLEHGQTEAFREQRIRGQIKHYTEDAYGNYEWDTSYISTLTHLKDEYPSARFIVFTTPVSDTLLNVLEQQELTPAYNNWLNAVTSVFDTVTHLMYRDPQLSDRSLFYDTQHFRPELAQKIAELLENDDQTKLEHTTLTPSTKSVETDPVEALFKQSPIDKN